MQRSTYRVGRGRTGGFERFANLAIDLRGFEAEIGNFERFQKVFQRGEVFLWAAFFDTEIEFRHADAEDAQPRRFASPAVPLARRCSSTCGGRLFMAWMQMLVQA